MDAIIAVDDAGRILLFNHAAERVFRCQAEEAIDGPCQQSLRRADGETFPVEAMFSRAETNGRVLDTVHDVQERQQRLRGLNPYFQDEFRRSHAEGDLIGASQGLRAVMENVHQVAATDASVLLLGETGTGKEMIARAIHASSTRKDQVLHA